MQDIELLKLFVYIDPPSNLVYSINSKLCPHPAFAPSTYNFRSSCHRFFASFNGLNAWQQGYIPMAIAMCIDVQKYAYTFLSHHAKLKKYQPTIFLCDIFQMPGQLQPVHPFMAPFFQQLGPPGFFSQPYLVLSNKKRALISQPTL